MYKYYGFGLNILSEIEMPELLVSDFDEHDVVIELGEVPQSVVGEKVFSRKFFSLGEDEYVLNVKDVCRYYALKGNKIIVQPHLKEVDDWKSIRVFLLGSVMAVILHQRSLLPMHSSAIVKDGKLVLFMGESGAGKSTLVANMVKKGFSVFTDDICILKQSENGQVTGAASYPIIKLWENSISLLEEDRFNREYKMRPHMQKFGQFFHDEFDKSRFPLSTLFILNPNNLSDKVTCRELKGVEAFKAIEKQAYRYRLVTGKVMRPIHFSIISNLVQNTKIYEISRPMQQKTIDQVYNTVVERI